MKHIGGFFELELPKRGATWHSDALALSTGRGCMTAILQHVKPKVVRMPFYVCDALIAPVREAGAKVEFYPLDKRLRPVQVQPLRAGELFVAVNYFGLRTSTIATLAKRFRDLLVADHVQAFFEKPISGSWTLYSARKCFGVPDGAYLYSPEALHLRPPQKLAHDVRHLVNRLAGRQEIAFRQLQRFEKKIDNRVRGMSILSERLLAAVDYPDARRRRRGNYLFLHRELGKENLFRANLPDEATPFCYPLLLDRPIDRHALARQRLYVPRLWEDVLQRQMAGFEWERQFARNLLPLPIDHRYGPDDMEEALRRLRNVL